MTNRLVRAVAVLGLVLAAGPIATAHHSFCAEHDPNKPFSFSGKVVSIDWANPHVSMLLEVKDDKSHAVQRWTFVAASSPSYLARGGWAKDTLKAGDDISVRGLLSKSGQNRGFLSEVLFKGMKIFTGSGTC